MHVYMVLRFTEGYKTADTVSSPRIRNLHLCFVKSSVLHFNLDFKCTIKSLLMNYLNTKRCVSFAIAN